MKFRRALIHTFLHVPYGYHRITKTGAFGSNRALDISGPIEADGNLIKTSLIKHHVKQFHEASCSVASVVSVVNALREGQAEKTVPITQMDILDKVRAHHWKERMSARGHNGKRGLPLFVLADVVKSSLDAYQIEVASIETVQAEKNSDRSKPIKSVLWKRLQDFETKGNCLIIAHFDQGAFIPALNIPHISPVGGFDPNTGDVVVLDVDRQQEKPYKISFDTFYKGISSDYYHIFRPFGFGSGGYIFIKLQEG